MTGNRQRMTFANPGDWVERAACKGKTDRMETPVHRTISKAMRERILISRSICLACPVIDECRDWALTSPDPAYEMMAGGLTYQERNRRREEAGIDCHGRSPLRVSPDAIPRKQVGA